MRTKIPKTFLTLFACNNTLGSPSFSFGKREDPGDEFFLGSNMASGVRLGGRLCFRVCMSAHHRTRYRILASNLSLYLWRYRLSSGINTVGTIQKNWKFYFGFFLTTCIPMLTLTLNNAPINGLPQDGGAGQPKGNLTFSVFQMSISPPLGFHSKSNSHPWGPQTFIVS